MTRKNIEFGIIAVLVIAISFFTSVYFASPSGSIIDFSHGALGQGLLAAGKTLVALVIGRLIWTSDVKKAVYKQMGNKENKGSNK